MEKEDMKNRPRIIIYILLNIIISAGTILFVMWLWDRSQPEPAPLDENLARLTDETGTSLSTPSGSENLDGTGPSSESNVEEYNIEIESIVGPGDLEIEYVEISNESQGSVDMTGWRLIDEDGQIYTFPTIILNQGGDIKVLSQRGMDTVIELYWQSDSPIWESGETARLLDESGNIISTYSIP
jgi:hypothetical protein